MPQAARLFGVRVHDVPDDLWTARTPCNEWSVHDLVNHVVAEHLWAPHLLRGETIEDVGDRYDGDVIGDEPAARWDTAIAGPLAAWAEATDDQIVHLSMGEAPIAEYANQMLMDLAIHAWDLAQGAGLPDRLDPDVVEYVGEYAEQVVPQWQGTSIFAAPVKVPGHDRQDQLIGLTGRHP
ncbi:MAG: TIGR03086 family metal-binding protein [Micromonosporaceae bacterium]